MSVCLRSSERVKTHEATIIYPHGTIGSSIDVMPLPAKGEDG